MSKKKVMNTKTNLGNQECYLLPALMPLSGTSPPAASLTSTLFGMTISVGKCTIIQESSNYHCNYT